MVAGADLGDNTARRAGALPARTQTHASKATRADPKTMALFSQEPSSAGKFMVIRQVKLGDQTAGPDQIQ